MYQCLEKWKAWLMLYIITSGLPFQTGLELWGWQQAVAQFQVVFQSSFLQLPRTNHWLEQRDAEDWSTKWEFNSRKSVRYEHKIKVQLDFEAAAYFLRFKWPVLWFFFFFSRQVENYLEIKENLEIIVQERRKLRMQKAGKDCLRLRRITNDELEVC